MLNRWTTSMALGALLAGSLALTAPTQAQPDSSRQAASSACTKKVRLSQVLIYGDSITSRPVLHENHGQKGWFEFGYVGHRGRFKFSAKGRSRYATTSKHETLPTMYSRLGDIRKYKPKVVVIAGGVADGVRDDAPQAIRKFYTRLKSVIAKQGIPACNVYAFVLRPERLSKKIPAIVKTESTRIGAQYVNIPGYTGTYDRMHPTTATARTIWKQLRARSTFPGRLK